MLSPDTAYAFHEKQNDKLANQLGHAGEWHVDVFLGHQCCRVIDSDKGQLQSVVDQECEADQPRLRGHAR